MQTLEVRALKQISARGVQPQLMLARFPHRIITQSAAGWLEPLADSAALGACQAWAALCRLAGTQCKCVYGKRLQRLQRQQRQRHRQRNLTTATPAKRSARIELAQLVRLKFKGLLSQSASQPASQSVGRSVAWLVVWSAGSPASAAAAIVCAARRGVENKRAVPCRGSQHSFLLVFGLHNNRQTMKANSAQQPR